MTCRISAARLRRALRVGAHAALLVLFWGLPVTPSAARERQPAAPAPDDSGVAVMFRGQEVFRIHRGFGSIDAPDRARLASERLDRLVDDAGFDPAAITVRETETASELVHGDRLVGVITDEDARAVGRPRAEYARQVRDRLVTIVTSTREEFTALAIVIGLGWAILATAMLTLALWLLRRAGRRIRARVDDWYGRLTADTRVGRAAAVRATRVGTMVHSVVRLAMITVGAALVAVWVQVVLQMFPWSRPLARLIFSYGSAPILAAWRGFAGFVPNLFYLVVIAGIAFGVLRLVRSFFGEIAASNISLASFPAEWAEPTYKLVRVLLLAITLVAAFPYLPGAQSPAFQGISIFFGLLISLSSSSALSNIIAGSILTYTRAFRLGDVVKIGETLGAVTEKRLLVTRLQTPKNETVSIPNSLILTMQVRNYTTLIADRGLILHTTVTLGYDAPWRTVHALLIAAALRTDGVARDPSPFVFQTALNDFSVSYEINAFVHAPRDILRIYSDLHANIQECFNEAGVEIMSPNYFALRDGNRTTTPGSYLSAEYEPPSFRVRYRGERRRRKRADATEAT